MAVELADPQLYIVAQSLDGDGGPYPTRPIPEEPASQLGLRSVLCSFRSLLRESKLVNREMARPHACRTPSAAVTFWYSSGGADPILHLV